MTLTRAFNSHWVQCVVVVRWSSCNSAGLIQARFLATFTHSGHMQFAIEVQKRHQRPKVDCCWLFRRSVSLFSVFHSFALSLFLFSIPDCASCWHTALWGRVACNCFQHKPASPCFVSLTQSAVVPVLILRFWYFDLMLPWLPVLPLENSSGCRLSLNPAATVSAFYLWFAFNFFHQVLYAI